MINFGNKIRFLRKQQNISQKQAASQIGVSRPYFIEVESGKKDLTVPQIRQLANLLSVPMEELIFDTTQVAADDFNYEKYKQIILNCLKFGGSPDDGKITKTKLAKLAYLADFGWFYNELVPMSGLVYRRIPQGPVPDQYFRAIDELYESESINIEPKGKAIMIQPNEEAPNDKLSTQELNLIKKICAKWKEYDTAQIVWFTHDQLPWKLCRPGELIPYELITQEDPTHVF